MDSKTTRVLKQSNEIEVQFLRTELETGHTLLDVAEVTESDATRLRTIENAGRAYQLANQMIERLDLSSDEKAELASKLADLRRRLDSEWPDGSPASLKP